MKLDSSSIVSGEFSRLPTETQDEEIGKLFVLLGGIRISRNRNESDEEFRNRTFEKGLEKLPEDYEYVYAKEFFENRIIPSLIDDFKDSSAATQESLLDKLSELTEGRSIKRKDGESERRFRIRSYSRLLRKLPAGSEYEMLEFAREVEESEDEGSDYESEENESDEDSYEDSASTRSDRFHRGGKLKSKGYTRQSDESVSQGGSISDENLGGDTAPVEVEEWNDGRKKAGFNPNFKFKGNPGPKSKPSFAHKYRTTRKSK